MTTRQFDGQRLSGQRHGAGFLERLTIIPMHQCHEAGNAAATACGKGKDPAGLGRHANLSAGQVDDPAADTSDRLRALELGCAGLHFGGALRESAAQAAYVIDVLPMRARQESDQQQRDDDADDLHEAVEHGRR
jgi:hypothetical protein